MPEQTFADFKREGHKWITLTSGEYYPDILKPATELYGPVLILFGQILSSSASSAQLFEQIVAVPTPWMRVQLLRVFKKYVGPHIPVEMTKQKTKAAEIVAAFGYGFRPVQEVQAAFESRPSPDEAICAVLWEYKSRGQKGYDLTEKFFSLFRSAFPNLPLIGPERAGKDILLGDVLSNYPNPQRPVDFIILDEDAKTPLAVGLARYDSDRGGAQEDDRTGGYVNCSDEILAYAKRKKLPLKVIFINDGPGLLLGSMWDDYMKIEARGKGKVMVSTLRMIPERLTERWLRGS